MTTTTAGVRPHAGTQRQRGHRSSRAWQVIAKLQRSYRRGGWSARCLLTRTGIYRRSRTQTDHWIKIETRILGILVHRSVTPLTDY